MPGKGSADPTQSDAPLKDSRANDPAADSTGPPTTSTAPDSEQADSECEQEKDRQHRFTVEETVLIFDWDDTVLPSSWVQEQGLRLDGDLQLTESQKEELSELARLASETLTMAKSLGTVVLVTNAERGWIELSCQRFLPSLFPILEDVKLLSARSSYERPDLPSPFEWKLKAFVSEIARLFEEDDKKHRRKNILSFGDSAHEREALINATAHLSNCRTKSLKFVERPRIDQLRKQHALVGRCVKRIVHHDGNLDLCLRSV